MRKCVPITYRRGIRHKACHCGDELPRDMTGLSSVDKGEVGLVTGELWFCPMAKSVDVAGLRVSEGDTEEDRERDIYGRGGGFAGS
jgi:hypothetical protein